MAMESVKISVFKASCIGMLKKLGRKNSQPFIVTSRGEPIAVIYPYLAAPIERKLGGQQGSLQILGDIVNLDFSSDWESLSK